MRKPALACLLVLAVPLLGRAQPPAAPRYERPVHPGAPGPNRLVVDLPLLAGASPFNVVQRLDGVDSRSTGLPPREVAERGLSDLRLYDENGLGVPYLLVPPPTRAPDWVAGQVLAIAGTKKESGFEVDLQALRRVDAVAIVGLRPPYLKRARLEGSGDRARWTVLAIETSVFDLPEEKLARTEIEFAAGEYRYLRVTWDDASSARLPQPRGVRARLAGSTAAPAPLRAPLVFERRASEPGVSRYRLSLPGSRLPIIAIELAVSSGYVLREARVTEARLTDSQMAPVELGSAVLRRAVHDEVAAADLRVPISAPQQSYVELVVEDGSNPPLELTGVTAVFAELPWIYFEAESRSDLVATFGSPKAAAPRYDLEAARPSIPRLRPAGATWGDIVDHAPRRVPAPAPVMPALGAVLDVSAFSTRRPVPAGPRGLTALRLDAAALAGSHIADLRLVAPDGRQVPYLVERVDEPLVIELSAEQAPDGPKDRHPPGQPPSSYRLTLPEASLPAGTLVLHTPARVFARRVRLFEEREDNRTREGRVFDPVAESTWTHNEPDTPAPPLSLALRGRLPRTLWLVIDEGDNTPLPLGTPRLLLPTVRLRFFRETDAPLSLLYGNPSAAAPRYDLALLAPRLVGAPAHDVEPGPDATRTRTTEGRFTPTRLFWGALVAAVVVLLVILGRLLRT